MAQKQKSSKKQDTAEQSRKRDASWARGQQRKADRVKAQKEREEANKSRVLKPWQLAKHERYQNRQGYGSKS